MEADPDSDSVMLQLLLLIFFTWMNAFFAGGGDGGGFSGQEPDPSTCPGGK